MKLSALVITLIMLTVARESSGTSCDGPYLGFDDEIGLENGFSSYSYVFVAKVSQAKLEHVDDERLWIQHVSLELYSPSLKGAVPDRLNYLVEGQCGASFEEGEIYLFFIDSLSKTPSYGNFKLVLVDEEGPGYTWVIDWIRAKRLTNQSRGDGELHPLKRIPQPN